MNLDPFWINLTTGVLLLIAYPTKALTNPRFYVKLTIIAVAVTLIPRVRTLVVTSDDIGAARASRKTALLAITSIVLWLAAITTGRLLPYTYHRLLVEYPAE